MKDDEEKLQRGYLLLDAFLKDNGDRPTPELFRQCWQLILKHDELFRGAATRSNRFNIDGKHLIYARFAQFFKLLHTDFFLPIKLAAESRDLRAPPGSIFLTLHSELEMAVAKFLQDGSHHVATITAGPARPQLLELFGLSPDPLFIRRDGNCLLLAREALMASRSLIVDVDYTLFDEEKRRFVHRIGISAFRFAKKMGRPLYFVKLAVNADGEIECTVRASSTDGPENGIAGQFRSFMGAKEAWGDEFLIGDWFADTHGKANAKVARSHFQD